MYVQLAIAVERMEDRLQFTRQRGSAEEAVGRKQRLGAPSSTRV